jgi:hypothetical protein
MNSSREKEIPTNIYIITKIWLEKYLKKLTINLEKTNSKNQDWTHLS